MSLITKLGFVNPNILRTRFHNYSDSMVLSKSTYAYGRTEKSFGYDVPITQNPQISKAAQDDLVTQLGNLYYPGWHSASLCRYPRGIGMSWHRDHKACKARVVLINIGQATFSITDKETVREGGIEEYDLEDGAVICCDSKLLHQIHPVHTSNSHFEKNIAFFSLVRYSSNNG